MEASCELVEGMALGSGMLFFSLRHCFNLKGKKIKELTVQTTTDCWEDSQELAGLVLEASGKWYRDQASVALTEVHFSAMAHALLRQSSVLWCFFPA